MACSVSIKLVMLLGIEGVFFSTSYSRSASSYRKYFPVFDISLGKGDRYYNKYYHDKISTHSKTAMFFRDLYEKNKLLNTKISSKVRIPRIIHQIWLGSRLPKKYKKWQSTWQSLPGFTYKLWTDEEVKRLQLINRDLFEAAKTYGQKADLLRIELLNQFGGLYVDMDFECINPEVFAFLHHSYDFYTGITPVDCSTFGVNNAIIGATKGHRILVEYIRAIRKNWHKPADGIFSEVVLKTGPGLFTKMFLKHANKTTLDIAFPPTVFYPLGLRQINFIEKYFGSVKRAVIKPESAAIHWWAQAWKKRVKKQKKI